MSSIFLETLKLFLNLKPEWIDSLDKGLCSYSFCHTRRHFKNFKRGIHYICQNDDEQQARILPFSNFHLRIYRYIEANATYGKLWAYVMNLVPGFQKRLFSKIQTNQNKQSLILISFFFLIASCSHYHKIRLAFLKPQLPTHYDNLKFRGGIRIWMQLQNY